MTREKDVISGRIREQVKRVDLRTALRTLYEPVEHDKQFDRLLRRLEEKEQKNEPREN